MATNIVTGWKLFSPEERDKLDKNDIKKQFKVLCILFKDRCFEGLINCGLECERGIRIEIDVDIHPEKRWDTIRQLTSKFTIYIIQFSTKITESIHMAQNMKELSYESFQEDLLEKEQEKIEQIAISEAFTVRTTFPSAKPRYDDMKQSSDNCEDVIIKAIEKLKHQQKNNNKESAHMIADEILCNVLETLGHKTLVEKYRQVGKWYA